MLCRIFIWCNKNSIQIPFLVAWCVFFFSKVWFLRLSRASSYRWGDDDVSVPFSLARYYGTSLFISHLGACFFSSIPQLIVTDEPEHCWQLVTDMIMTDDPSITPWRKFLHTKMTDDKNKLYDNMMMMHDIMTNGSRIWDPFLIMIHEYFPKPIPILETKRSFGKDKNRRKP